MFSNLGTTEIVIIAGILVFLFGSKWVKSAARDLGESTKEIKKASSQIDKAVKGELDDQDQEPPKKKKKRKKKKKLPLDNYERRWE